MNSRLPLYRIGDILITSEGTPFKVTKIEQYGNGKYYYSSITSKVFGQSEASLYCTVGGFTTHIKKLLEDRISILKETT